MSIKRAELTRLCVLQLCCLVFAMFSSRPLMAAEWSVEKSLELGIVHRNSMGFSENGSQNITVGQVKPSLLLTGRGNKANLLLLTELGYMRSDIEGDQELLPRLYGTLDSTIIDHTLFLDSNITVDTVIVSSGNDAIDSLSLDKEISKTAKVSLNPRLEFEIAEVADLRINYGFNDYSASSDKLLDSRSNSIKIELDSKVSSTGYQVGATANVDNTDFADGNSLKQRNILTKAGKRLGKYWQLNASIGSEWNDVPDQSTLEGAGLAVTKEQATIWDVGLKWIPGRRTSIFAGYGERSYGRSPSLEIVHQTRRSTYSLIWSRDLTRSNVGIFNSVDAISTVESDSEASDVLAGLAGGPALFVEDTTIAISEQVRAAYHLRGRVSSLSIESIYLKQESRFQTDTFSSSNVLLRGSLERRIGYDKSVKFTYEHARGISESQVREDRIGISMNLKIR